jgi:hypothetical protein
MGKTPGSKIKKMGSGVHRAPKLVKSNRSKVLSLGAMTGYGTAPKTGKNAGAKYEFEAPGFSPTKLKGQNRFK